MMRYPIFLLSGLGIFFLCAEAAVAQAEGEQNLDANAALKYWTAFALLPPLDKNQEKIIEDWKKTPLDEKSLKLIERSRNSRRYLYRGAALANCDWSLDYEDGVELLLPHCPKARNLARLTALHARHEFKQGHWKAGLRDVTALLGLAHHLEVAPLMIQNLVGYSIETIAFDTVAPYLPDLKTVIPEPFPALDNLSKGATLRAMVLKEREISAAWLIGYLNKAEKRKQGGWKGAWDLLFHLGEGENPKEAELIANVKTFEQMTRSLEKLLPCYEEMASQLSLPWQEFTVKYAEFFKTVKQENPLAGFVLPALNRMAEAEHRAEIQRALFKTALAIVRHGQDAVKNSRDPVDNKPFEYRALDNGFELISRFRYAGQSVKLVVGSRGT